MDPHPVAQTGGHTLSVAARTLLAVLLAVAVLLPALPARADDWTGTDKLLHFSASLAVGSAAFSGGVLAWEDGGETGWSALSFGTVALVGTGKECFDLASGREFSGKDLVWDLAGAATAVALNLLAWSLAAD